MVPLRASETASRKGVRFNGIRDLILSSRQITSLLNPSMSGRAILDGTSVTRSTQYDESRGDKIGMP